MESGVSMPHSQGLSNNLYPEPNQPRIDSYFFKIHSNIVLPSTTRPSLRALSCYDFESTPTFFHYAYMNCPSQTLDLINLTMLDERYKLLSFKSTVMQCTARLNNNNSNVLEFIFGCHRN